MTNLSISYNDLRLNDEELLKEYKKALEQTLTAGRLIRSEAHEFCESLLSQVCENKHSLLSNSGSSSLYLAFRALKLDTGSEVILPSLSWYSTAHALLLNGLTPVFCDVTDQGLLDTNSVKRLISSRTKAILVVHFNGLCADLQILSELCLENELDLIEDCAQAFEAKKENTNAGSVGRISCFSFNQMKVPSSGMDAGALSFKREEDYEYIKNIQYCGMQTRSECLEVSHNFRLGSVPAALLQVSLLARKKRQQWRRELISQYQAQLERLSIFSNEEINDISPYTFAIHSKKRNQLKKILELAGVETQINHFPLMPDLPQYSSFTADKTKAGHYISSVLSLPLHEHLSSDDITKVSHLINEFSNA